MTVNAPPKVTRPALRPSQKISEVSESDTVPNATPARKGASENRVRTAHEALPVHPKLVGEAGAEKDEREASRCEQR